MTVARPEPPATGSPPVVLCISDTAAERARLAGLFDGVGVLVMAADAASARAFLGQLRETGRVEDEPTPEVVRVGGLRLDVEHHEATWHHRRLSLTQHELKVLTCLARRPGRVLTYRQLHDHAWDQAYFTGPAAVRSVIKRLRAKLRQWELPLRIETARGLGFRLTKGNDLHLVSTQA
ncbi:winged helix-turn-helix domain-containing protein [Actinophytocola sediminis]